MEKLDSVVVTLVQKMKEIVSFMMNVKMVFFVYQVNAHFHSVLSLLLIVVLNQFLVMNIFVHMEIHVEKMKEIVILTVNVKATKIV